MDTNCLSCQKIRVFENTLDRHAHELTEKVNSLCANVRARNKMRWEKFAREVNFPLVGSMIYNTFRAPAGLESDPDYLNSDWYRSEGSAIERRAGLLETMKAEHMEHWGDELVIPGLGGDPSGYYTSPEKIKRRDAYDPEFTSRMKNACADKEGVIRDTSGLTETYFVHIPDKYDFTSAAGVDKLQKGIFVLDVSSKRVVPLNQCNWSWTALKDTASNAVEIVVAHFARTGCVYTAIR